MKYFLLVIFILINIIFALRSYAAEYSLDDLFMISLNRSETIKTAEEDLYISEREKDKSLSVFLPTISAFGDHTRYTEAKRSPFGILQPDYTNQWGLRLEQSFSLSGRELTGYKIRRAGIQESSYGLATVKEEYLLLVAASYYDVLKSTKALEIAQSNTVRLERHRDAAKLRLEFGESTKTALLRAQAELAGAQAEEITSSNNLKLARAVLARTAGIDKGYTLNEPPSSDYQTDSEAILSGLTHGCASPVPECLKEKAFSERSDYKKLSIQRDIAEKKIKYAKGLFWPNIELEGVYSREENEPSRSFELSERIYGMVRLDFPFYEGGLRVAEVKEAQARLRQATHAMTDLKKQIAVEIDNAYLSLMTVSSVISSLLSEVAYAEDNFNAVTKQFQHGLSDSIDVIDANTLLLTAEKELANARYDYELAVLSLRKSVGVLLKTVAESQPLAAGGNN